MSGAIPKSLNSLPPPETETCACDVEDVVPDAATPETPSHEDENVTNVLKYFAMLRPAGPAATILAKVCTALYSGGSQSVKDYCCNVLGFTNAQYRKVFNSHERNILEVKKSWEVLDISILYKLLQRVCDLAPHTDEKWSKPSPDEVDDLEHMLYLIRSERNFVVHEAVNFPLTNLQGRSTKLKSLLENIMCKVSIKKNLDFSQDVKIAQTKIDDILNSTSEYSFQIYQQELESLRHDIVKKLVAESRSELFPYYTELWSSSLVKLFPFPIAENSVSLQGAEIFTNTTIIDENNSTLSIEDILTYRHGGNVTCPRVSIIEGIAGIGKSFICKYILHKWASGKGGDENLMEVEILIFIQCHSVNSKSLREYFIEELMPKTCSALQKEDVIPALQNCYAVFIIDGLDEAGSNARAIMRELNTKFSKNRKIITCRPEFTEEAKTLMSSNGKDTCVLFAKGFNEDQRKVYLGNLLSVIKNNVDDPDGTLNKFYNKIKKLEHKFPLLLSLPLMLMMLVSLCLNEDDSLSELTTINHIHQQTLEMKVKELSLRTQRRSGESRHISLIERQCKKWLMTLSKVAWLTLNHNSQILDKKCIDELLQEAENNIIEPMDALSCFMKCSKLENTFSTEYAWEFFHKTFQEYLTALYISQNPVILSNPKASSDQLQLPLKASPSKSLQCSSSTSASLRSQPYEETGVSTNPKKHKQKYALVIEGVLNFFRKYRIRRHRKDIEDRLETDTEADATCEEFSYSIDNFANRIDKQNTLQFLAAMETSKQEVNNEYIEKIIKAYHQGMSYSRSWVQWTTFLRECCEHPTVCQIIQEILYRRRIEMRHSDPNITEKIGAVNYLLRKTRFCPKIAELRFYEGSLPDNFGLLLCTLKEFSPGTPIIIHSCYFLSSGLLHCFNQLSKMDKINLLLHTEIREEYLEDFISLVKYLKEKNATLGMTVMIRSIEILRNLAHCCTQSPLPMNTTLHLWISFISEEMLMPLCQVLKSFQWQRTFVISFQDYDLSENTQEIQQILTEVLRRNSIKLTNITVEVEAYAYNRLKTYEEMAQGIANELPCHVIFEDRAEDDKIILTMEGVQQD